MQFDELKSKVLSLPLLPGVYIMKNADGEVIYVGKAKKLKNRVSQYFQDTASHNYKTRVMVSKIADFDIIVAATEFEALVLECSLIKQHKPKYNILLKDDKGYPFLRINLKDKYPTVTMVKSVAKDGASYFGPFGSRSSTQVLLKTLMQTLKLPTCEKKFPCKTADRPCLNFHMNQCDGWCQNAKTQQDYYMAMLQMKHLLSGNYKLVADEIKQHMHSAADSLQFELAAALRDKLNAVETLGKKQLVNAANSADTDVIGLSQLDGKFCISVLHYQKGNLFDKYYLTFPEQETAEIALSSFVKQFYLNRGFAPKNIYLPFAIEDKVLLEEYLQQLYGRKTKFTVPRRGDNLKLVSLAVKNAEEELYRIADKDAHVRSSLTMLANLLSIPTPNRIESFDISNISGTDIVGGMVVFCDGKPCKSEYKRFRLADQKEQNDYAAMETVLTRRFNHYVQQDDGFSQLPDLLLIDGGVEHAQVALRVLRSLNINVPVFGMVKDDRHRTRALVTPEGEEIGIITKQAVYALIGNIQEHTHNFAIGYHKTLRKKRIKYSELDEIAGVGQRRKHDLLRAFKSIRAIKEASIADLSVILPNNVAHNVYKHFHNQQAGE